MAEHILVQSPPESEIGRVPFFFLLFKKYLFIFTYLFGYVRS